MVQVGHFPLADIRYHPEVHPKAFLQKQRDLEAITNRIDFDQFPWRWFCRQNHWTGLRSSRRWGPWSSATSASSFIRIRTGHSRTAAEFPHCYELARIWSRCSACETFNRHHILLSADMRTTLALTALVPICISWHYYH
jgi:hypothetical protein